MSNIIDEYKELNAACKKYSKVQLVVRNAKTLNIEEVEDRLAENRFIEKFCLSDDERNTLKLVRKNKNNE